MAKSRAQQPAIAISMKKAGKKPKSLTKAQKGIQVQPFVADKTAVKINVPKINVPIYNPFAQAKKDAEEKLKIAKKLYKDNPGKVYYDAVKRAEQNLSRYKQTSGMIKSKKKG